MRSPGCFTAADGLAVAWGAVLSGGDDGLFAGAAAVVAGAGLLVPAGAAGAADAGVEVDRGQVQALDLIGLAEGAPQVHGGTVPQQR